MLVSDFDFRLPETLIALRPAEPRDGARLLVVRPGGGLDDRVVRDLADLLAPGDVLVVNDTRVISARLSGIRRRADDSPNADGIGSGVAVEATLLKRLSPTDWTALMRPGKRLRPNDRIVFGARDEGGARLRAVVVEKGLDGEVTLAFELAGRELDHAIEAVGVMPLPPYIAARRVEDEQDRADYQTAFARHDGSVAAPTAGLHFTPELLARLDARGVTRASVTLHVGAGTFLPVKAQRTEDHRMHPEWGEVTVETAGIINAARARGGRIVCVGTTSLRLLESACDADGRIDAFTGETDIFITPGRGVRAADGLLTNFHLPRSTLLMLVSAFAGVEVVHAAYAHAIAAGYRFYSYGDTGLWFRNDEA